jgi:thiol-disulfide isomerase/thioredoxin
MLTSLSMRMVVIGLLGAAVVAGGARALAEGVPAVAEPSYFASLTGPACPVTDSDQHWVETTQLRVLYFPESANAKIKNPKSLVLHIVFNNGESTGDVRSIAFSERDGAAWIATASLTRWKEKFAVYWVEDPETKQSDTAGGSYFQIPFCTARGVRAERSEQFEAESYTGVLGKYGIQRPQDFRKAIEVLEEYIRPPEHGAFLLSHLWQYKLHLGGNTPEARAALAKEIDDYAQKHSEDAFGLMDTLNFAAYQDWIPDETIDRIATTVEKRDPKAGSHMFALSARANIERDREKRVILLRKLIEKYPDSEFAQDARIRLILSELTDLHEREAVFEQSQRVDPNDANLMTLMAEIYVDANKNLERAETLLDQADKLFDANPPQEWNSGRYTEAFIRLRKGRIAILRAEILVTQGKSSEALAILVPREKEFQQGTSFYVLGQALENTGQKRAAADAYLEAVIRPSSKQEEATAALRKIWKEEKIGDEKELQARIETAAGERFRSKKYSPRLISTTFDDVELTTLSGERIATSQFRGKTVVIDFWGTWCPPCVEELKDLQNFQAGHPDVLLLAIAETTAERATIEKIVRRDKLERLKIAISPLPLWERFGLNGVPETLVIDGSGTVRVEHLGMSDVGRTLEADLGAIRDEMQRSNEVTK